MRAATRRVAQMGWIFMLGTACGDDGADAQAAAQNDAGPTDDVRVAASDAVPDHSGPGMTESGAGSGGSNGSNDSGGAGGSAGSGVPGGSLNDGAAGGMLSGPLTVSSNPRYFQDANGKALVLVGSHTW